MAADVAAKWLTSLTHSADDDPASQLAVMQIARRTVAKYREELKIPSSSVRRTSEKSCSRTSSRGGNR